MGGCEVGRDRASQSHYLSQRGYSEMQVRKYHEVALPEIRESEPVR